MYVIYNWEGKWPRRVAGGFSTPAVAIAWCGYDPLDWVPDNHGGLIHKDGAFRIIPEKGLRATIYGERERDYE